MKTKYKILLVLFLVAIVNINIISATELDDNTNLVDDNSTAIENSVSNSTVLNNDDGNNETNDNNESNTNESDTLETNETDTNNTEQTNESDTLETNETDTNNTEQTNETEELTEPVDTHLYIQESVLKGEYLNIVLKDINGNLLPNQTVKFQFNNKEYTKTTDSTGTAKLKINLAAKTYSFFIDYEGTDKYNPTNYMFDLRVIKPISTAITVKSVIVYKKNSLIAYLKTSAGKALSNQKVNISIKNKTYTRTTDKNGAVGLKINLKSDVYPVTISYGGKNSYLKSSKKIYLRVREIVSLGSTSYGKVQLVKIIGNTSSKVKIAYVVGLHPLEHQIHDAVYKLMLKKTSMKYAYYVYKITLTKKSGDYSTDRMRGQMLAKTFIVPHVNKQKYNLVIDVHSTTGTSYKHTYFIHVPQNKHKASLNLAYKTINTIKSIEANSQMRYWSPESQTSPPYLTLPIIRAGTPTFVFETWTYESISQTNKRANILINAVDKIFG